MINKKLADNSDEIFSAYAIKYQHCAKKQLWSVSLKNKATCANTAKSKSSFNCCEVSEWLLV